MRLINPSSRPARPAAALAAAVAALAAAVAAVCVSPAVPAIAEDTPGRITPTHQVHVKLLRKAPTPTLEQIAPDTDALAVYTYEVVKPPKGGAFPDQITVTHWAVYRKAEQRVTGMNPGKKSTLTLAPWDAAGYQDQVRRIEALAERHPQTLFFYDLNNLGDNGLDDADFENIDHVDASGAEKVSRRVEAFRPDVERRPADQP